jgi:hypothetical protein
MRKIILDYKNIVPENPLAPIGPTGLCESERTSAQSFTVPVGELKASDQDTLKVPRMLEGRVVAIIGSLVRCPLSRECAAADARHCTGGSCYVVSERQVVASGSILQDSSSESVTFDGTPIPLVRREEILPYDTIDTVINLRDSKFSLTVPDEWC